MKKLHELIDGQITDITKREEVIKNLLIYCGQDSLAMVKIFQKILQKIS